MDEQRPNSEKTFSDAPDLGPLDDRDDPTAELVAYLDGELAHAANAAIEGKISRDATVRAEVDSLKKTWDLLDYLPRQDPSPQFTERTISQLGPIRKTPAPNAPTLPTAKNGVTPKPLLASTEAEPIVRPRRSEGRRFAAVASWLLVLGMAGAAGYFGRALFVSRFLSPMDQHEKDAQILSDRRLLQNMRQYRHIDDIEFLKSLDQPELFGEEQTPPQNEGPK